MPTDNQPLVVVNNLSVNFRVSRGFGARQVVKAVDGVTFTINEGETLGIAGESGSGKSTLARTMIRIIRQNSGSVLIDGMNTTELSGKNLRLFRKRIQMVYQDPYDSLDPRMRIQEAIGEALSVQGIQHSAHKKIVEELLEKVNLPASIATRFPGQLSGGQRQRISIARALAVDPKIIICDEAVAALDVSIRAQILNLLKDLQAELKLGYLFISHDLSTLRFMADRIGIMYAGRIVEYGNSANIFKNPQHPYTKTLLDAVPRLTKNSTPHIKLKGEPPDLANQPTGCAFNPRCPIAVGRCRIERPLLEIKSSGEQVACHQIEPAVASSKVGLE